MQSEPYPEPKPQPEEEEPAVDDMESLLGEEGDYLARRGDIRMGQVIEVTEEGALIDLGLKREGFAPARDLRQLQRAKMGEVKAGDEVPVMILNVRDDNPYVEVSIYQARLEEDWLEAERLFKSGEIYETEVAGYNRGGLTVRFGRIRGFVPLSHIVGLPRGLNEAERRERLAAMVGQPIGLRVIEVDRQRRRLIFSQRQAYRAWQRKRKQRLLEELEEGQRRRGKVSSITNFGIFVDLGGVDGLVHISELSWQHVDDPHELYRVGDEVEVVVLEVDRDRERIGLSIRQTQEDPWTRVEEKYRVDQLVEGRVTRVTDIGAFVELEPGVEGLLHVSELIGGPGVTPQEVLHAGDEVLLKVLRVEPNRRRIGLSARRVRQSEWEQWMAEKAAREAERAEAEEAAEAEAEEPPAEVEPPTEAAQAEGEAEELSAEPAEAEPVEAEEPSPEPAEAEAGGAEGQAPEEREQPAAP